MYDVGAERKGKKTAWQNGALLTLTAQARGEGRRETKSKGKKIQKRRDYEGESSETLGATFLRLEEIRHAICDINIASKCTRPKKYVKKGENLAKL